MKKRLLVIDGSARALVHVRGSLLKEAVFRGHAVYALAELDCLTKEIGERDVINALSDIGVVFSGCQLNRASKNPVADIPVILNLYRHIKRLRPDVVLCYSMKSCLLGSIAGRIAGIQNIFTSITGLGYLFIEDNQRERLFKWLLRSPLRIALRLSKSTFFQNSDDINLLLSEGFLDSKEKAILVNGSGVDLKKYRYALPPLSDKECTFLMIGRIHRQKGVEEYIEASRIVKKKYLSSRFLFIGPYEKHPSAVPKLMLERWKKEGPVEFLGTKSDVYPFIRDSDVFVLPSWREGTSRSMLEALATGRPIIATDVPGCKEPVINDVNGYLIPVRSPSALAEAMIRLIEQPEKRLHMGIESRRIAEERYNEDHVVRLMLDRMGL